MAQGLSGLGWHFPVTVDGISGSVRMAQGEQDIEQAIRIILFTARGERVMHPDFGCGIHDLVFEDMSTTTLGLVESSVREALFKWEPRIEVLSVSAENHSGSQGQMTIELEYRIRSTSQVANSAISFQINNGQLS